MKAWYFSDSHTKHGFLDIPDDIDIAIFGGDGSNQKSPAINANEMLDFIEWYNSLTHIKYKVMIAGNHDTSLEEGLITRGDIPGSITYLEHESVIIEGVKIFGSPYTPQFGSKWAYNVPRGSLKPYWDEIPLDTQILVTHGPPKGILDLTQYDTRSGADGKSFFQCGCLELLERVRIVEPEYHLFGHIHTELSCPNAGVLKVQNCKTTFMNGAVCDFGKSFDGSFKNISNNGFIFDVHGK